MTRVSSPPLCLYLCVCSSVYVFLSWTYLFIFFMHFNFAPPFRTWKEQCVQTCILFISHLQVGPVLGKPHYFVTTKISLFWCVLWVRCCAEQRIQSWGEASNAAHFFVACYITYKVNLLSCCDKAMPILAAQSVQLVLRNRPGPDAIDRSVSTSDRCLKQQNFSLRCVHMPFSYCLSSHPPAPSTYKTLQKCECSCEPHHFNGALLNHYYDRVLARASWSSMIFDVQHTQTHAHKQRCVRAPFFLCVLGLLWWQLSTNSHRVPHDWWQSGSRRNIWCPNCTKHLLAFASYVNLI